MGEKSAKAAHDAWTAILWTSPWWKHSISKTYIIHTCHHELLLNSHLKKKIQLKFEHLLQLHWRQHFPSTKATLWTFSNNKLLIKTQTPSDQNWGLEEDSNSTWRHWTHDFKHKAGAIQTTPKTEMLKKRKGRDPEEIRQKSSKRHNYKIKWEETQNKAGASAGEDNP